MKCAEGNNCARACEQCHQLLWVEASWWPASLQGHTDHSTKEGVLMEVGDAHQEEMVRQSCGGVVSRDKARQMEQTMKHRRPCWTSTTTPHSPPNTSCLFTSPPSTHSCFCLQIVCCYSYFWKKTQRHIFQTMSLCSHPSVSLIRSGELPGDSCGVERNGELGKQFSD